VYACVSSSDQKSDLAGQVGRLVAFANDRVLAVSRTVREAGSGLNPGGPMLLRLLPDPCVRTIVVRAKDMLMPFGSEPLLRRARSW
jgi:predicted site-specific integrase-resolvase